MIDKRMWGAIIDDVGKLTLKEVPTPVIEKDDDVIIRVKSCGICGTDLIILKEPKEFGFKPNTILGHEISGTVESIGNGIKNLKTGDSVVIEPNKYCDVCHFCKMNLRNLCDYWPNHAMGVNVHGGFAKYCKTSEKLCHKISSKVSFNEAAFTEVLADVLNGAQKVKIQPWESVVILGGGSVGITFLRIFKICGAAKVILSELWSVS